ncbi:hypothetical protein BpHYR1_024133 [Brachionus plicatilis]|uniref:Uncharacterized protein n=1 Tax=Brachionus plicatilis TaxID=10195 RepID=A0A3M7TAA1_BRAPC|nr:hypothetical protein BpHYR1_024133 [Brachionus plicatilis]
MLFYVFLNSVRRYLKLTMVVQFMTVQCLKNLKKNTEKTLFVQTTGTPRIAPDAYLQQAENYNRNI